jgi:hypothetical protein
MTAAERRAARNPILRWILEMNNCAEPDEEEREWWERECDADLQLGPPRDRLGGRDHPAFPSRQRQAEMSLSLARAQQDQRLRATLHDASGRERDHCPPERRAQPAAEPAAEPAVAVPAAAAAPAAAAPAAAEPVRPAAAEVVATVR